MAQGLPAGQLPEEVVARAPDAVNNLAGVRRRLADRGGGDQMQVVEFGKDQIYHVAPLPEGMEPGQVFRVREDGLKMQKELYPAAI
ncbi:MAG: hypothetical protein OXC72_01720 [Roseovarius sp.]|nr:hypothetical protein [Roseovarius sp.]